MPPSSNDAASGGTLEQRLRQLQEALAARELQLERKSNEVSQVQALCDQLQVKDRNLSFHSLQTACNIVSAAKLLQQVVARAHSTEAASDRSALRTPPETHARWPTHRHVLMF